MLKNIYKKFSEVALVGYGKKLSEEKNRASRYLNDGIKLAQELSDARRELSDAKDRMWSLECVVKSRDDMLDRLTKDLLLAARSESMATERAWHAVELAKILKARLAIYETPRGDDFSK